MVLEARGQGNDKSLAAGNIQNQRLRIKGMPEFENAIRQACSLVRFCGTRHPGDRAGERVQVTAKVPGYGSVRLEMLVEPECLEQPEIDQRSIVVLARNRKEAEEFARAKGLKQWSYGNGCLIEGSSNPITYCVHGWTANYRCVQAFEILTSDPRARFITPRYTWRDKAGNATDIGRWE